MHRIEPTLREIIELRNYIENDENIDDGDYRFAHQNLEQALDILERCGDAESAQPFIDDVKELLGLDTSIDKEREERDK